LADPPEPAMLLDVREPAELGTGVVPQSIPIPLGELTGRLVDLPRSQWTFVHCQSGYRSSIAGSLLRRAGFERVVNVTGGFNAWKSAGLPVATPETNPKVRAV
ncbi:MAG TPA: rhodanese-like domain-containing protein, partial [Bryobacteraceae bacterium]|nr:rhodanese-like domain-containing protein [Bryobacteraceae bacterium]